MPKFNVHLYPVVRVKIEGIDADTPEQAIEKAYDLASNEFFHLIFDRKGSCPAPAAHIEFSEGYDGEVVDTLDGKGSIIYGETLQTIRLVAQMHGGTIQQVFGNLPAHMSMEIVFTEGKQYLDDNEDRDENGDLKYVVASGTLAGEGIYTHLDVEHGADKDIDPVFEAAQKRADNSK